MTKRVLIISYYWPPAGGSGVQRWVKFAKYLPQFGWHPVIYTPSNPELTSRDGSIGADIPEEVEVIKRRIWEPYAIYHLFRKKLSGNTSEEVNPINGDPKTFLQKVFLWIRANLFIPDPRIGWVGPSVDFLEKYLMDNPVDAVITTGPPHSMHLIGRRLSKRTALPWIADFRDPWTDIFYFKYLPLTAAARCRHEALEEAVLKEADAVIAVSPAVQEDFWRKFGREIELITNGYDEDDFASVEAGWDGYFNIVHTGQFASSGIPLTLWKVLSEKAASDAEFAGKLRLRLVGQTDREVIASLSEAGLEGNVVDLGYRSHREAVKEQKGASLLILPLRREPEYAKVLPGKLFEYLASGRPVLGIGQSGGAMAAVLRDSGAGVTCEWNDEAAVREVIDRAWEVFLSGEEPSAAEGSAKYSRRATAAALVRLLEKMTADE